MAGIDGISWGQRNGGAPAVLIRGDAPGESGVQVRHVRFHGGAHFATSSPVHLICFHVSPAAEFHCRAGGRDLRHLAGTGMCAILPAGVDSTAESVETVETLVVAVDPGRLALAASETATLGAGLDACLASHDLPLLDCAGILARESAAGYPSGPLFWSETAFRFLGRLAAVHAGAAPERDRGVLAPAVLARLRDYVAAHLDGPIGVATLAAIAGRSEFNFIRVFTRSVGMTPHRYVVHQRLGHAARLVREGRLCLAQIAARTGFADQSHLSRWMRRVYGASPTNLTRAGAGASGRRRP